MPGKAFDEFCHPNSSTTNIKKMKNLFLVLAVIIVPVLSGMNKVNAQSTIIPQTGHLIEMDSINAKALKNFIKINPGVSGEKWVRTRFGFSVKFILNGIHTTILYNNKGNWFGTLRNYTEEKLPVKVRDIVKRWYYDYSIFYVDEVETLDSGGFPTYIIHIENKTTLKLIRVCNGEMEVWKEYVKG
jgi:hypothetical protein